MLKGVHIQLVMKSVYSINRKNNPYLLPENESTAMEISKGGGLC